MCYEDEITRDVLQAPFQAAINVWHYALGPRRGINFQIIPSVLCPTDPAGRIIERDTVIIKVSARPGSSAAEGFFIGDRDYGRHIIRINPYEYASNVEVIAVITHELG